MLVKVLSIVFVLLSSSAFADEISIMFHSETGAEVGQKTVWNGSIQSQGPRDYLRVTDEPNDQVFELVRNAIEATINGSIQAELIHREASNNGTVENIVIYGGYTLNREYVIWGNRSNGNQLVWFRGF